MLTLSKGDADIAQTRAGLILRHATSLSESRLPADPAALAALRADQQRVAALLRGENPAAAMDAQLRQTELELRSARQSVLTARQESENERAAWASKRQDMVPKSWMATLAGLLIASVAAIGWLLLRRVKDRGRHQHDLVALSLPEAPLPVMANAEPGLAAASDQALPVQSREAAPPVQTPPAENAVIMAAMMDRPPLESDWGTHPHDFPVATGAPQTLDLPASWLAIEKQIVESRDSQTGQPPLTPHTVADSHAQDHAAEVAGLLLASESWMAEHNPVQAAKLLRPYLAREDMLSPAPGLYLLTLYRTLDDQEQIQVVRAQMQACFPVELSQWNANGKARRSLADFPKVQAMMRSLEDSDGLLPYLKSLLLAPERFDFFSYREIVHAIGHATETPEAQQSQVLSLNLG